MKIIVSYSKDEADDRTVLTDKVTEQRVPNISRDGRVDPPWDYDFTYIGKLTGTGDPIGTDQFDSGLYLAPPDYRDGPWIAAAGLGGYNSSWGWIFINENANWIDTWTLLHERGHNLEFMHEDDDGNVHEGVMGNRDDMEPAKPLDYSTTVPARNTDGFKLYDWTDESIFTFQRLFTEHVKNGALSVTDLQWAFDRFRSTNMTDLLGAESLWDNINRTRLKEHTSIVDRGWYNGEV